MGTALLHSFHLAVCQSSTSLPEGEYRPDVDADTDSEEDDTANHCKPLRKEHATADDNDLMEQSRWHGGEAVDICYG